jgi:UTP--glucose-1-phosphate uridylyltransferase
LSESINELAQTAAVYGKFIDGAYHDTGNPELYLQTVVDVALSDPALGPGFRRYLKRKLADV